MDVFSLGTNRFNSWFNFSSQSQKAANPQAVSMLPYYAIGGVLMFAILKGRKA